MGVLVPTEHQHGKGGFGWARCRDCASTPARETNAISAPTKFPHFEHPGRGSGVATPVKPKPRGLTTWTEHGHGRLATSRPGRRNPATTAGQRPSVGEVWRVIRPAAKDRDGD